MSEAHRHNIETMKLHRPKERLRFVLMRGNIVEGKEGKQRIHVFTAKPGVDCPVQQMTAPSRWELVDTACELISAMEREKSVYAQQ